MSHVSSTYSMHPLSTHTHTHTPFLLGEGVEPPAKFSKGGGLTGYQFLEGGSWQVEDDFFQGDCSFYIKNILKSEIFNDKKVYKLKYFSVINKNLTREIFTKDLGTLRRLDGFKDENF